MDIKDFENLHREKKKQIEELNKLLDESKGIKNSKIEFISSSIGIVVAVLTVFSMNSVFRENIFSIKMFSSEKNYEEKIDKLESDISRLKLLPSKESSSLSPQDLLFLDDMELRITKIENEIPRVKVKSADSIMKRITELEVLLKKDPEQLIKYHILSKDFEALSKQNELLRNDVAKLRDTLFDFYKWFIGFFIAMLVPYIAKLFFGLGESKKHAKILEESN